VESTTLTWAARRYLMARYDELQRDYSRLSGADGYRYTTEAKRIFPRYNVVAAIITEVERLDQDRLPGVETVAETLLAAADGAESPFNGEIEAEAVAQERRLFAANVRSWRTQPDLRADPVPYRRVLAPGESALWRAELRTRWGVKDGSWHPLLGLSNPPEVLVLTGESMWDDDGVAAVRGVLRELGRARVVELREYGPDHLLDVDIFAPRYTGPEGLWSDTHHDWIAYASHEGTVAFGGVLAVRLMAAWPGFAEWR
jgi:hypothetical protein